MRSSRPLTPGVELAPGYDVVGLIDRGPSLEIYDVWSHERSCRCVAKTVRPGTGHDERHRRKVLREGRLLRRLSHPHLVRAYETIERPRPIVILETLTGETLAHVIDRLGRLPPGDVAMLGVQLCSAIGYLHRNGVLHLDLKPSNIVCDAGYAKVLDLSVARRPGRLPAGIGTDGYLSPEQALGGEITTAADVWGIGTVLFEALTGELPHPETLPAARGGARRPAAPIPIERPAPPVRSYRPLPRGMASVVDDCLALWPTDRPSVVTLSDRLGSLIGVDPRRDGAPTAG